MGELAILSMEPSLSEVLRDASAPLPATAWWPSSAIDDAFVLPNAPGPAVFRLRYDPRNGLVYEIFLQPSRTPGERVEGTIRFAERNGMWRMVFSGLTGRAMRLHGIFALDTSSVVTSDRRTEIENGLLTAMRAWRENNAELVDEFVRREAEEAARYWEARVVWALDIAEKVAAWAEGYSEICRSRALLHRDLSI